MYRLSSIPEERSVASLTANTGEDDFPNTVKETDDESEIWNLSG